MTAGMLPVGDEPVRLAVIGKLGWIKRQRAKFEAQPRQSQREMVDGESHYFMGQRYRLRIVEHQGTGKVVLQQKTIMALYVRPNATVEQREQILTKWYRERLKSMVEPLLQQWQSRLGVAVVAWGVRKMKTKWGSCSTETGRIWINLELAKKPAQCLEYIIVHELVHLLERKHNDRFHALLDTHLPAWRLHRDELNRGTLAHECWDY